MVRTGQDRRGSLGLHAGELVEVRSVEEILATLDANGALDGLPFMPEMLPYCGKRFRVDKRADKTCDTIGGSPTPSRRMMDAVHLDGLRCDGASHGGCQAQCLLFWKEAWLKRAETAPESAAARVDSPTAFSLAPRAYPAGLVMLEAATVKRPDGGTVEDATQYVCQATELQRATTQLEWWDARQYFRELWSGNISLITMFRTFAIATFNTIQRWRGGGEYPRVSAHCIAVRSKGGTPTASLNLQPGEVVRIRSQEEIFATLNQDNRNRGLYFDVEMLPFCGRTAVVRQRVDHIIDERTGKMRNMANPCIMLEGAVCTGCLSRERLFCPRSIYSYWREIWLERVPAQQELGQASDARVPSTNEIESALGCAGKAPAPRGDDRLITISARRSSTKHMELTK